MRDMLVSAEADRVENACCADGVAENRPNTSQLANAINSGRGLP